MDARCSPTRLLGLSIPERVYGMLQYVDISVVGLIITGFQGLSEAFEELLCAASRLDQYSPREIGLRAVKQAPNDCDIHHEGSGDHKANDSLLGQIWEIESPKLEGTTED